MTRPPSAAFDDWVERARAVTCRAELERRGLWRARMLGDAGVPCPGCGGTDRFAVNVKKNLWTCRKSGTGGDAIALVGHVDGASFLVAVEILTGEPQPDAAGESRDERAARVARLERRAKAEAEKARRSAAESETYRQREREEAWQLWRRGRPIAGTPAEAYLARRGLVAPAEAKLRFAPDAAYFAVVVENGRNRNRAIHVGPALLAAIQGPGGHFLGLHRTWLDLDHGDADGKAVIRDAAGERLAAKKVRGSKRGGTIRLAGHPAESAAPRTARRSIMGEGIETTLSAWMALRPEERAGTEFSAAVDLGNMAGKAAGRLPHPTETKVDTVGRVRRVFVADAVPAADDDTPLIGLPESVEELILLGDGDSDAFATGLAMQRAGTRFADGYPGVTVRLAMARAGLDFNAMLREAA